MHDFYSSTIDCALFHEGTEQLDLTPLRLLPRLFHLISQGDYKDLYRLAGLTQLECVDAEVLGVHSFAPRLHHLVVQHRNMMGTHMQALSACTGLTLLALWSACLVDSNGHIFLESDRYLVPTY